MKINESSKKPKKEVKSKLERIIDIKHVNNEKEKELIQNESGSGYDVSSL